MTTDAAPGATRSSDDEREAREVSVVGPDGTRYLVRAARRGTVLRRLGTGTGSAGTLGDDLLAGLVVLVVAVLTALVFWLVQGSVVRRLDAWKVGVFRDRGRLRPHRLLHKETLPRGTDPAERIATLVAAVRAGTL